LSPSNPPSSTTTSGTDFLNMWKELQKVEDDDQAANSTEKVDQVSYFI